MSRAGRTSGDRAEALRGLLETVAEDQPGPAGGWSAAAAVGLGAALAGMAARASGDRLPDSQLLAHRADRLRARAVELAEADVAVYRKVLDAGGPRPAPDTAPWRARLATALAEAADVPLSVAEAGAETAALAVDLATRGHPPVRPDARTGAALAEAGARAAAELVAVNTASGGLGRSRADRAHAHAGDAAACLADGGIRAHHDLDHFEHEAPQGACQHGKE